MATLRWGLSIAACILLAGVFCAHPTLAGQGAGLSGRVSDPDGALVVGAKVEATNIDTNVVYSGETNSDGLFVISNITPGRYRVIVSKQGFKTIVKPDVTLHVQDALALNFAMQVGSISQSMTIEGGAPLVNTESATISTVVDRHFVENLPLNGRSFQSLIELTPGVVVTPSNSADAGQFSVNGQRAVSNYWTVDGVSANTGVRGFFPPGNGLGGALASLSAQGGTNSMVSVDALEEFRIQTSTYAPEFGRTPGAQVSILTRSGTNRFHGTLFEYFRNDVLDANSWFANRDVVPKPAERQNDFGGTFSGPVFKNKTFFFFSYEGLRLRLPQVATGVAVPDAAARAAAVPAIKPFIDSYPIAPAGSLDDPVTHIARFSASYSNSSNLDAYSIRLDHSLRSNLSLFGRYSYAPSDTVRRGGPLSNFSVTPFRTHTATIGSTWAISSAIANDLRFNYTWARSQSAFFQDTFMGAVPISSLPFPSGFSVDDSILSISPGGLFPFAQMFVGTNIKNVQKQINIVDSLSWQSGGHAMKFGVDFRRLAPEFQPRAYSQFANFANVNNFAAGTLSSGFVGATRATTLLFRNVGLFAQDTWRVRPRLTLTYGLRWDVDVAPDTLDGANLPSVTGFDLKDLSHLDLAPEGTPPYKTTFGNVAPRISAAYEVRPSARWQTVVRGGFGVFYDMASSEVGNGLILFYPFGATRSIAGSYPLGAADSAPPPITAASLANPGGQLNAYDPKTELPYTLEWDVVVEQGLGDQQMFSLSYVGASGKRLLQTAYIVFPTPAIFSAQLVTNSGKSSYHALQAQFQRRLSRGLQSLVSYTWAHSIDTTSGGSVGGGGNTLDPTLGANQNKGNSDFDIRHTFSAAITYDIPAPVRNSLARAVLAGWSLNNTIQVRSAPPVDLFNSNFFGTSSLFYANTRPDVIGGVPLYLFGSQYPGGKAFNPAAFTTPPLGPPFGFPISQGNFGRNILRGFGAAQWDLGVRRDFPIYEDLRLEFRAEMFNVLNHPNFAPPISDMASGQFGVSTQILSQYLGGNVGGGGLTALYQLGGPRSIQLALKLIF
jgi:Carboxypeptidase regulatory-like domain/TonB dependent receptor-like, beta-barrel